MNAHATTAMKIRAIAMAGHSADLFDESTRTGRARLFALLRLVPLGNDWLGFVLGLAPDEDGCPRLRGHAHSRRHAAHRQTMSVTAWTDVPTRGAGSYDRRRQQTA